ncbi:MAG: tetratricopeptide repeat protein, partial [Colwellia sp.]|nr:tetratricopeptide repeat protein [Colwellia sp.]
MILHFLSEPAKKLLALWLAVVLLSACQNTAEPSSAAKNTLDLRATLADLANEQLAEELENKENTLEDTWGMSKAQCSATLAALYQNILTLEPNEEVRAKIEYRLVQIDTQAYEYQADSPEQEDKSEQSLAALVASYQALLTRFPNRAENEEVHYQLAKALDLQGKLADSLLQIESFLLTYPDSHYAAELHFRRGDIYYNLQHYSKALLAYQAVIASKNSAEYYVNSVYMSGWTLFKLNRLPEADDKFLGLLDYIVGQEKIQPYEDNFSFSSLDPRYVSLVNDIQRVLSVSLSQQQQSKSLVALVSKYEKNQQ